MVSLVYHSVTEPLICPIITFSTSVLANRLNDSAVMAYIILLSDFVENHFLNYFTTIKTVMQIVYFVLICEHSRSVISFQD